MRKIIYSLLALCIGFAVTACNSLDVPPMNIAKDDDLFTSADGISYYMSSLYSWLPIEDFKYSCDTEDGFMRAGIVKNISNNTGESCNGYHVEAGGIVNPARGYWKKAYEIIRNTNYFIATLPKYAAYFNNDQAKIDHWIGEARFLRAYTYFALVKRYGGVPLLDKAQQYPGQPIEELRVPRNSEEEVYDCILADLDYAYNHMYDQSEMRGRVNKYIAAAFKSRAMLTAGSIAKYNTIEVFDKNSSKLLTGVPASRAKFFFEESYKAAKLLEGRYSLKTTAETDKEKMSENFASIFYDVVGNPECIFAREYKYLESGHSYDNLFVPYQLHGDGYSNCSNPTLDLVELYDGFAKNADGTIKVLDDNGKYRMYDNAGSIFDDCEPRLRGTVLLPNQLFKGVNIDLRLGIYTGPVPAEGIAPLLPAGATNNSFVGLPNFKYATGITPTEQQLHTLPNGKSISISGINGPCETSQRGPTQTGLLVRKMLDPDRTPEQSTGWISDQPWIELRYAEVLLNRAEAALELHQLGAAGADYQQDAFECINAIRSRAGAVLLTGKSELSADAVSPACYILAPNRGLQIVRVERRKELAFENKIWWDMIRWRTADTEMNNRVWRKLNPILVAETATATSNGKYIIEARNITANTRFTFQTKMYYEPMPLGELNRNPNLTPNQSN